MGENGKAAVKNRITVQKELRKYFWPVTKAYLQRVVFFLLYCAVLIFSVTAKYLERFRVGGAFVAVFMGMGILLPWIEYFKSLKVIEEKWPSGKEQEELERDFIDSVSVFRGEGRIGKKFTFWRRDASIVPVRDVKDFFPVRVRAGVRMQARLTEGEITVAQFPYNREEIAELAAMLDEAKECLKEKSGTDV